MSAAASIEASSLATASERSKDPAKVAAGQKGGQTRAANAAAKQSSKQPEAPAQAAAATAKQREPNAAPFELPRRAEDYREGRLERERRAATPALAAALGPVLADPVIAGLSGPSFRVFVTLLCEAAADGLGRVTNDADYIIARACWSDWPLDRWGDREAAPIAWERIRRELAALGLIELGEDDCYVYVPELAGGGL